MVGDYHAAQVPYLQAEADKMREEIKYMPAKYQAEWNAKMAEMDAHLAAATKSRAETGAIPAETAKKEAETRRAQEETRRSEWERAGAPSGTVAKMAVAQAMPYRTSVSERGVVVTDERTGQTMTTPFMTGTFKSPQTDLAWKMAGANFLDKAKSDILSHYGADTQKAQKEFEAMMIVLGKEGIESKEQASIIMAHLSPENKALFTTVMDLYRQGETSGIPLATTQTYVNAMLGAKAAGAAITPGLREKPVPGAAPAPRAAAPPVAAASGARTGPPPEAVGATGQTIDPAKFAGQRPGPYKGSSGTTVYWDGTSAWVIGATPSGAEKPTAPAASAQATKPRGKPTPIGPPAGTFGRGKTFRERLEEGRSRRGKAEEGKRE